jgi:hypothetical protein
MKIDVTDEVYKELQKLAQPFVDTPNEVILRLLKMKTTEPGKSSPSQNNGSCDLVTKGGTVLAGTKLQAAYKRRTYSAEIIDGKVVWNGNRYPSLSDAAVAVIKSTGSGRTTEDGWRFWKYLDKATNEWKALTELR